jgi:cysteinyl-tRNA synthetase
MNITDVDDKIILAARQQHLLAEWLAKHKEVDQDVRDTTLQALAAYLQKNLPLIPSETTPEAYTKEAERAYGHVLKGKSVANDSTPPGDKEAKVKMHLNTTRSAAEALQLEQKDLDVFALKASGVLLPYIDSLYGSSVQGNDHEIFTKLTKKYEQRFFDDMKSLNVQYPNKLTRVTEYGPQIVDFVKRIEENGYAYEHEGSVYYDTGNWEKNGGVYARLEPWNRNDKELQADGEGSLSTKKTGFKRSGADFALWKGSKPGEPSWASPWGEGRPGWHIECSAMASDVLGKTFDIHSGGIDLSFPHHDNELAQSEAYWCTKDHVDPHAQWVNYFLHMGHLSIQGSKMSKSLKNFTTIREAISQGDWTPRSLRIVFLLGNWRDGLEITGEVVKAGVAWEEKLNSFFIRVRDIQQRSTEDQIKGLSLADGKEGSGSGLLENLSTASQKFHDALCDSFDTPTAMRVISDLITAYNSASAVPETTSIAIAQWLTEQVHMFGLDSQPLQAAQLGWSGIDIPEDAKTHIYPLASLRDRVREQAIAGALDIASLGSLSGTTSEANNPYAEVYADFQRRILDLSSASAAPKEYLAACDHLRDTALWNLSIYLEDRENQPSLVRPLSASLRQERADREKNAAAKAAAKEKAKRDAEAAEKERLEKGKLNHLEMFRTSEYSAWDAEGLPTADAEGKEVAKSKAKKLRKDWERQKKLHEAWSAAQGK